MFTPEENWEVVVRLTHESSCSETVRPPNWNRSTELDASGYCGHRERLTPSLRHMGRAVKLPGHLVHRPHVRSVQKTVWQKPGKSANYMLSFRQSNLSAGT
jgi:hypothetical protein